MIGDRWNVTPEEIARPFPCDGLVADPTLVAWRGVTTRTTVDRVWPWLVQVRVAPYSYDLLDNLGRHSPRRLLGLADPVPGDPFSATAGRPLGRVLSVTHEEQLTARIMGVVMSYVLVPRGPDTRLLLKIVGRLPRPMADLLSVGDLVMARRQLLNLARLAEGESSACLIARASS